MSALARDLAKPIALVIGAGYFVILCVTLVWWHLSPEIVLALTLGGLALMTIALRPYLGVHAFLVVLFVENSFASREGVTMMKVIGAIVLAGWLVNLAMTRRVGFRVDAGVLALLLFNVWGVVTVMNAYDGNLALLRFLTFPQLAVAALMFRSVVNTPERLRGVYAAIVAWTLASTLIAIVAYYMGLTPVARGLAGNRNLLALQINLAITFAYLLHQSTPSRLARAVLASSLPVFFLGLALTLSRTGLIVEAMALLLVWYRVARERGFLILAGSVTALSLIMVLLPALFWARVSSILPAIERQEETFGTRVRLWEAGLRMAEDHPLTGVGPGNFVRVLKRYGRGEMRAEALSAHNTYVSVAAETGLVGLGFYLALFLVGLREARRASLLAGSRSMKLLAVALEVNLLIVMASGLVMTVENLKYIWILFGLAMALASMTVPLRAGGIPRVDPAPALAPGAGDAWRPAPSETR